MNLWLTEIPSNRRIWAFGGQKQQTVYRPQLPAKFGVEVDGVKGPPVTFTVNNKQYIEKTLPYLPTAWTPSIGTHKLRVSDGNVTEDFVLEIKDKNPPDKYGQVPDIKLFVIDGEDDKEIIRELVPNGSNVMEIAHLPPTVRFLIRRIPQAGSLEFNFVNLIPNPSGKAWAPKAGKFALWARAFSGLNQSGAIGPKIQVDFTITSPVSPDIEDRLKEVEAKIADPTPVVVEIHHWFFIPPIDGIYTLRSDKDGTVIGGIKCLLAQKIRLRGGQKYEGVSMGKVMITQPNGLEVQVA